MKKEKKRYKQKYKMKKTLNADKNIWSWRVMFLVLYLQRDHERQKQK